MKPNQANLYGKLLETYIMGGDNHNDRMQAVRKLIDDYNGEWLRRHRKYSALLNELEIFLLKKTSTHPLIEN